MAKYNQSSIAGETWTRAFNIGISNPYPDNNPFARVPPPSIFFGEETVCKLQDGSVIRAPLNHPNVIFFAKEEFTANTADLSFPILNSDGVDTGKTATFSDVYEILSSLYVFAANRRDARIAEMTNNQNNIQSPPEVPPSNTN